MNNQARTNSTQQSDTGCYRYSGPMVQDSRVNQCDQRREEELHHQPKHAMQNSAPLTRGLSGYKYSGPMVDNGRVNQCDSHKTDGCFKYSGAMVDAARVDQCEPGDHDPKKEQTSNWQPLGLDHQSGYSYLYQHSGYERAETEQEKQAESQSREEHCLD